MFDFFKRKRARTLGEIDTMTLAEATALFDDPLMPNTQAMLQRIVTCKHCFGELIAVTPEIKLGELILKECRECHERFYV